MESMGLPRNKIVAMVEINAIIERLGVWDAEIARRIRDFNTGDVTSTRGCGL